MKPNINPPIRTSEYGNRLNLEFTLLSKRGWWEENFKTNWFESECRWSVVNLDTGVNFKVTDSVCSEFDLDRMVKGEKWRGYTDTDGSTYLYHSRVEKIS